MTENDPKPIPRKTPKKKGEGPSMREQILARKRAEAAANGPAAEEATEEPAAKPAPKRATPRAGGHPARSGSGRSGARGSAKRGGGDGDGDERRSKRTRRERPQKKKSPVPLIATGALVVVGGALAFISLGGGDEKPTSDSSETAAAGEGAGGANTDGAATPEEASAAATADEAADAAGEAEEAAAAADEESAEATESAAPEPKAKPAEPEPVDLSALEPFGKPEGATDEQWAKLQEDAAMFFDVDAGAAGGRARRRLEEAGKLAWPAILNEMIKLDPAKPQDNQQGMLAQRALNAARGSQTSQAFDWRTPDDGVLSEKNLRYNRKLIKALYDSWAKVVEDPSHWKRIDKAEAAAEAKADTEKKIEDEFDFDPSDLEGLDG
ncbi:MAG: hypothetical protein ACPGPE_03895 [Planctomycetota bacterium]